jgi:hypothetical protein
VTTTRDRSLAAPDPAATAKAYARAVAGQDWARACSLYSRSARRAVERGAADVQAPAGSSCPVVLRATFGSGLDVPAPDVSQDPVVSGNTATVGDVQLELEDGTWRVAQGG